MSNALTQFRKTHGLTLADMAERLNVATSTVCKWELRRVPADRVVEIETTLGIPRHDLRPDLFRPRHEVAA